MLGGDVSAMYAGAMTEAMPTPMPPRTRKATTSHTFGASAVPIALTRKNKAAIFITEMRPIASAIRPADMAPTAAPSSADATANPSFALSIPKSS
jgi:hypothetical protein